jgi:hypothetical protein
MTLAQFPIFAAALTIETKWSKRDYTTKVENAMRVLSDAIEADGIAPTIYKDVVKDTFNRAFEHAWEAIVTNGFDYGRALPEAEKALYYDLNRPEAHTVQSGIKKIAKAKLDTEFTRTVLAFLNEIAPLGAEIVSLRNKLVKRQPKPVEDRKAKYEAPRAGKEAIFAVKATLVEVTNEAHAELIERIDAGLKKRLEATLKLAADVKALAGDRQKARRADEVLRQFAGADSFVYQITERNNGEWSASANSDSLIATEAAKRADAIREHFVYKNLEKIDSILESKGDFDAIKIIGRTVSLGGLEGSFLLTFKDGARFEITNSVVYSVSKLGNPFLRFPLTFHNVVFGNGTRMKMPSEEKMNAEFVGA